MVELKDAAISIRVSLISALSLLKGISMISFNLSLSSFNVGRVVLSRMRLSSKPVGMETSSRPLKDGMENSGTSMLILMRFVKLCAISLGIRGLYAVTHVDPVDSTLDNSVRACDILLNARPYRVERVGDAI